MFIALNEDGVKRVYKTGLMDDPDIIQLMEEKNINYAATIPEQPNAFYLFFLHGVFPSCSLFPAPCDEQTRLRHARRPFRQAEHQKIRAFA